jgi:hypothetical protein
LLTGGRFQVLGAAFMVAVIIYVHRVAGAGVAGSVQDYLTNVEAGWLIAAFLLAYGGFEMPWGWAGTAWCVISFRSWC